MKKILTFLMLSVAVAANAQIDIRIDATKSTVDISPMLYGIFYEDINHAADGGIYAELIRNRSFEDNETEAEAWSPYTSAEGNVSMNIVKDNLLNNAQHQALHVVTTGVGNSEAGVQNGGYWGINAVKGRTYKVSLWVKTKRTLGMNVILKGKNGETYASAPLALNKKAKTWQHITTTITSTASDPEAQFVVASTGNSDFYLDVVSLFPPTYKNRENGLRPDLVEMLYELHPRFMRFPGGCFVEGQETPDNAFRWERTIGPIEERPGHWNKNWGYRTSDGLGYHEYLQLAEDLGAKALYVTNIGIWHGGVTPLDSIQPWIDECLNAIEYANGSTDTKYGAMRAKNGHPAPFNLKYIEVGNENNQTDGQQTSDHYYDRYRLFRDAIMAKYPDITIVGDVAAWGTDDPRWLSQEKVQLVDEHYYRTPAWFAEHFHKYDSYDRSWPHVYCGEYAVTQGFGDLGNLNAALGEAVYMMGMENNGDIVEMSSYAPIFVNERDDRWRPDMVRFNPETVMGTPSYYVQKLMSDNLGTRALNVTEGQETVIPTTGIYTPDECKVGVATWRTHSSFKDLKVTYGDQTITDAADDKSHFKDEVGDWKIVDGAIRQTADCDESITILQKDVKGTKYSFSAKARKEDGREGFILVFNFKDVKNYCWINFGGWGDSQHGVESIINGGKSALQNTTGSVESGKWYDIRVDVDGNTIKGYLNGEQVIDTYLRGETLPGVFTSASMDDKTGELIVKIVNTTDSKENTILHLDGFTANGADLIQLKAKDGYAENTLDEPTQVYPTKKHISLEGNQPEFLAEPYSLNILRIRK